MVTPSDEVLNRTFQLAYFILGDRTASLYLAMAALDKLKIAAATQERRRQYVPTGRAAYPAVRTKVSLSRLHLLQRLIYKESEPFERLLEAQGKALRQQDMIVRFVKHLVMVTTRRNSFYVALGLCRLLHNYTTVETAEVYDLVLQNPDRGRDDDYFRDRKKHLLREFKERFGGSLKIRRGHRGEERFQAEEDSGKYRGLVRECLLRFMPWESSCVLPANFNPAEDGASALQFSGGDPDQEHEIELNRIHSLLHPDCLDRLVMALGLDPPSRRLEVPHFSGLNDDRGLTDDRFAPPALNRKEMDVLRRCLEGNAARREAASKKLLAVLIDGDERARFEVARTGGTRIRAAEGSEWLEVRSVEAEEDVILALHPMPYYEGGFVRARRSVVRGAGHALSFAVEPAGDSPATAPGVTVSVSYQETGAVGPIASLARRFCALLPEGVGLKPLGGVSRLHLAFGSVLIMICVAGLLLYYFSRSTPPGAPPTAEENLIARHDGRDGMTPPSPSPPQARPETPAPRSAPHAGNVARRSRRGQVTAPTPGTPRPQPTPPHPAGESETTRGRDRRPPSKDLLAVRRIYVDPLGGGALSEPVREALIRGLLSTGRFVVVESRGEAEAVFEGSVTRAAEGGENRSVTLRLVNVRGDVIWIPPARGRGTTYSGHQSDITGRVIRDLLAEIRRLEGRR